MKFRSDNAGSELNGFVDRGSHLKGELRFETTFRVEGKITGTITSSGNLVVGEHGEVEGEIKVGEVFVAGAIRGTIEAERRVQIAPGGRVYAELRTPALVIEDGALFEGRCGMEAKGSGPQNSGPQNSGPPSGGPPGSGSPSGGSKEPAPSRPEGSKAAHPADGKVADSKSAS